jgi:hypothetical protein
VVVESVKKAVADLWAGWLWGQLVRLRFTGVLQAEQLAGLLIKTITLAFNMLPDAVGRFRHNLFFQCLYLK